MRIVLDTNVIVSATLIRGGNEDRILRAWQEGDFDLVLSPGILEEMGRTLLYEKLSKYHRLTGEEIAEMLESFAGDSVLVPGKLAVKASRDPDDDKFLAAAIEAKARYIVTGDKDLLDVKSYRRVRMIRPRAFLKILQESRRSRKK